MPILFINPIHEFPPFLNGGYELPPAFELPPALAGGQQIIHSILLALAKLLFLFGAENNLNQALRVGAHTVLVMCIPRVTTRG